MIEATVHQHDTTIDNNNNLTIEKLINDEVSSFEYVPTSLRKMFQIDLMIILSWLL